MTPIDQLITALMKEIDELSLLKDVAEGLLEQEQSHSVKAYLHDATNSICEGCYALDMSATALDVARKRSELPDRGLYRVK